MICPKCGIEANVIDSRQYPIYRRRRYKCNCGNRFSSVEITEINSEIFTVIHRIMTMNGANRYQFKKAIHQEYIKRFERGKYYNDRSSKAK